MELTSGDEEVLLEGRSRNMTFVAALLVVGTLVILGVIGLAQADWSFVLGGPVVIGGLAGFCIAWALSSIRVLQDEVILTNMWRIGRIRRDAIREILAGSGIALVLQHGKVLGSSAFPPSLGKAITHNRHDMPFAQRLGTTLQVPVTEDTDVPDDSMGTDPAVSWSLRWQTLGYAAGASAVSAAAGALLHVAFQR